MRFSFWVGNGHPWSEILRSAKRAEDTGWDGVWFADHFMPLMGDTGAPMHEVWTVLAALGAVTERVRLGPLVCGNTYRNPALLAKQAVSADHIAGGRIVLGIGAGWQENEHEAYGFEFGTFTDRFQKMEEALQMLHSLRSEERTSFDGAHYHLADAPLSPKPVGSLPIMIGGGGERKTLRMVAQYADEWNVWADPEIMTQKSKVLNEHCERQGRDPSAIQRSAVALLFLCETEKQADELRARGIERPTLIGTPAQLVEQIAAFAEIGVDEVIIPDFNLRGGQGQDDIADQFLAEVASSFR
ncbi:MAG: LLM class F420-dependent oxidoreductase [Actinomycetia bacterium]|nr:LLM class F420-dependent oxidoreductase [Actinomycetes bacterium]MCP5032803.1 LLM class F420-dependent oxidoreductase [Actinomycetes bacterium]